MESPPDVASSDSEADQQTQEVKPAEARHVTGYQYAPQPPHSPPMLDCISQSFATQAMWKLVHPPARAQPSPTACITTMHGCQAFHTCLSVHLRSDWLPGGGKIDSCVPCCLFSWLHVCVHVSVYPPTSFAARSVACWPMCLPAGLLAHSVRDSSKLALLLSISPPHVLMLFACSPACLLLLVCLLVCLLACLPLQAPPSPLLVQVLSPQVRHCRILPRLKKKYV